MKKIILVTFLIIPLFGMEKKPASLSISTSETCFDLDLFGDLSEQLEKLKMTPSLPPSPMVPRSPQEQYRLSKKKAVLHQCLRKLHNSPIPESSIPKEDSCFYGPIMVKKRIRNTQIK
jgi:hypothetical protein